MELRDLRVFMAVLELGGMTSAARRLHVVQSAVSQAVKRLEDEVGLALLERRSDGVRPTEAGAAFGAHATRILDGVHRLEADMASYRGQAKGVVRVGMMATIAGACMAPLLSLAKERLPAVTLQIREGVAHELLEALRLGRLDLIVVVSPIDTEDIPWVETGTLPLALALPRTHALGEAETVSFGDLTREGWISFPRGNPGRRWIEDSCRTAGFRPTIAAEVDTLAQLKSFVEAGHGITLLPAHCIELEVRAGTLATSQPVDPTPLIHHGFASHPQQTRQAVTEVRDLLVSVLDSLSRSAASRAPATA